MDEAKTGRTPSDDLYHCLVEEAADAIYVADATGRYVFANESGCHLLRYGRDELLQLSIPDVLAPQSLADGLRAVKSLAEGQSPGRVELSLVRKDGAFVEVELRTGRLPDGRIFSICRDISARLETERQLRESEHLFRDLVANLPALFWVRAHPSEALLYASPGWERILGHAPVLGEHVKQLFAVVHDEDVPRVMAAVARAPSAGFDEVVRFVSPEGAIRWYQIRTFPVPDASGAVHRVAGLGEDITEQALDVTERRAAERALADSEARYRSALESMNVGIVVHAQDGAIVSANSSALRILGLTVDQMMGRTSLDPRWRAIREDGSPFPGEEHPGHVTLQTGEPRTDVIMGVHKPDDTLTWISITSRRITPLGEQGAYSVVASFTDITERRAIAEKMEGSLREKEVLLKEVHHRVKNNLQIVSSLLYLQSTRVEDQRLGAVLRESRHRVSSMALVHQMLTESADLSRIPFGIYARDLTRSLYDSYGASTERITLRIGAGELVLHIGAAVPCGLILSEIVSNALKHGFPGDMRGTLEIDLTLDEVGYLLRVSDDGVGLPADVEQRAKSSLGMKLVDRLSAQIGGVLERSSGEKGGTRYQIRFPREVP
jgi:PAS domain S-box-containing protein